LSGLALNLSTNIADFDQNADKTTTKYIQLIYKIILHLNHGTLTLLFIPVKTLPNWHSRNKLYYSTFQHFMLFITWKPMFGS